MSRTAYKHEGALLKTSCELLSSCLRNEQKLIEREMATFQRAVKKVMLEVKKKGMTPTSLALLESLIKQIAALKKKVCQKKIRKQYYSLSPLLPFLTHLPLLSMTHLIHTQYIAIRSTRSRNLPLKSMSKSHSASPSC